MFSRVEKADNRLMRRLLTIAYGAAAYVPFLAAFLYAIGFLGNIVVPRSVDHGLSVPTA